MTPQARPARGLYIVRLNLASRHLAGVARKIDAQAAALQALPAQVQRLCLADARIELDGQAVKDYGDSRFSARLAYYFGFHFAVASLRGYDFAYLRYQGASPLMLWALHRLRRNNPGLALVVEVPTFPYDGEKSTLRERLLSLVDKLSRRFLRPLVDRIVTFSRQERIFGIPTLRTDNGVDVQALAVIEPPPGDTIHLLGLANLSAWHGYDRVIAGLADYYDNGGTRDVRFHVVGEGVELPRLQALAEQTAASGRIAFLGSRTGPALETVLAGMHVGISSLGMHRIDTDTSNLKSREFCARGLPFVLGYADRDFSNDLPFVFRIPADDTPLDVAALVDWFDGLRTRHPDYPATMRAYAEQRLSWTTKMSPVVEYLRDKLLERT